MALEGPKGVLKSIGTERKLVGRRDSERDVVETIDEIRES